MIGRARAPRKGVGATRQRESSESNPLRAWILLLTVPIFQDGDAVIVETGKLDLNLEDVDRAEQDFASLDEEEKIEALRRLVDRALRANHRIAKFIVWFISRLARSSNCSAEVFERSFMVPLRSLVDTSLDAPRAYDYMGRMLLASELPQDRVEQLSQHIITDGDPEEAENKLLRAYRARLAY